MSDVDRAELRRLLDESARPGEVFQVAHGHHYDYAVHDRAGWTVAECAEEHWVRLIAAAVNALPDLLEALEEAEGHWDSLDATLIEVQREKLALERAIERVRALHYAADNDSPRTPRCNECQGRAGAHPCGCWAEVDREPVCGHCAARWFGQRVSWPCPTIQAIGGEQS